MAVPSDDAPAVVTVASGDERVAEIDALARIEEVGIEFVSDLLDGLAELSARRKGRTPSRIAVGPCESDNSLSEALSLPLMRFESVVGLVDDGEALGPIGVRVDAHSLVGWLRTRRDSSPIVHRAAVSTFEPRLYVIGYHFDVVRSKATVRSP